jgi:hypothetical protein
MTRNYIDEVVNTVVRRAEALEDWKVGNSYHCIFLIDLDKCNIRFKIALNYNEDGYQALIGTENEVIADNEGSANKV